MAKKPKRDPYWRRKALKAIKILNEAEREYYVDDLGTYTSDIHDALIEGERTLVFLVRKIEKMESKR